MMCRGQDRLLRAGASGLHSCAWFVESAPQQLGPALRLTGRASRSCDRPLRGCLAATWASPGTASPPAPIAQHAGTHASAALSAPAPRRCPCWQRSPMPPPLQTPCPSLHTSEELRSVPVACGAVWLSSRLLDCLWGCLGHADCWPTAAVRRFLDTLHLFPAAQPSAALPVRQVSNQSPKQDLCLSLQRTCFKRSYIVCGNGVLEA